jgi:hypothetical protein
MYVCLTSFLRCKANEENTSKKAFLILNELIVALKVYSLPFFISYQLCIRRIYHVSHKPFAIRWIVFLFQKLKSKVLKIYTRPLMTIVLALLSSSALFYPDPPFLRTQSKKESRRLAYDVLLAISNSLRSSESNSEDSDLQRLFTMVMGYLSSPAPHIVSGAIAALSLLIYNDANFCLEVPNLIPSVLVLLKHKAIEVIKASLGFVKVLVTSLHSEKLLELQADIMSGILPWSSVTKHHFKGKVSQ